MDTGQSHPIYAKENRFDSDLCSISDDECLAEREPYVSVSPEKRHHHSQDQTAATTLLIYHGSFFPFLVSYVAVTCCSWGAITFCGWRGGEEETRMLWFSGKRILMTTKFSRLCYPSIQMARRRPTLLCMSRHIH